MFRKGIFFLFKPILGKKMFQKFFEILYDLSLFGMNFGFATKKGKTGEISALDIVKKNLDSHEEVILFDVGANVGDYSELLIDNFAEYDYKIYTFEPSNSTFQTLNSKFNNHKSVYPYNLALGDSDGELELFKNTDGSRLASLYKRNLDYLNIHFNLTETIQARSLDSFCHEHKIENIKLLKIDVEGHELNVLEGAKKMLEKNAIEFIQFEFGGSHVDSRNFFIDFYNLLSPRFNLFRVLQDGLYPIENYSIKNEQFTAANYIAKRKKMIN